MTAEAAGVPRLHVVGCVDCEKKQRALDAMMVDLDNLNADLTAKRRIISSLKNELADRHRSDPLYATAEVIFDFWRKKCMPGARTFSEDRLKAVLGRLKDRDRDRPDEPAYPPRYICEAVLGAAVEPSVKDGKVYNDIELICRSGKRLEEFHRRYERWKGSAHR